MYKAFILLIVCTTLNIIAEQTNITSNVQTNDILNITTLKGITYENCEVKQTWSTGIKIFHSKGIQLIPFTDLSTKDQKKHGYKPKEAEKTTTSDWYKGGTLHTATFKEWSQASYTNRLATTADFVFKVFEAQGQKVPSLDKVKPLAVFMEKEISSYCTKARADKKVMDYVVELVRYMQSNN